MILDKKIGIAAIHDHQYRQGPTKLKFSIYKSASNVLSMMAFDQYRKCPRE